MILNASNICTSCGAHKTASAITCAACDPSEHSLGRKPRYTDEQILAAITRPTTVDDLMHTLDVKHKTTLIKRLRRLRAEGHIIFQDDGARRDGYRILPRG